jgi:3-oxoacyl-[acyl-carrier-protein] synthase III
VNVLIPSTLGRGVRIAGVGGHLPARVVTNDDVIASGAPLTKEEIAKLTGILERRHVAPGEATTDLALAAARRALAGANKGPGDVDRLVLATGSPDYLVPSAACVLHQKLGLSRAPAYDLTAACSGFVYALDAAARAVLTGDRCVLAVAADVRSRFIDPTDRATAALFGDGAGAAVVVPAAPGEGILGLCIGADGSGHKSVHMPAGGSVEPASEATVRGRRHYLKMADGPQVYLSAVEGMIETAEALLSHMGLGFSDLALVVPHQANKRLLERMTRLAGLDPARVFIDVERTGNMSGASSAFALYDALSSAALTAGDRVLLIAAGAGYTAGAALLVVDEELLSAARSATTARTGVEA